MGFLKDFFTNVLHEEAASNTWRSSFEELSQEDLEAHLSVAKYGDFTLTDAVRPSFDLKVTPRERYRHDVYRDEESQANMPVLMCSASKERLFELFIELIEPLGKVVDVVLETSHSRDGKGHSDLYREHMDVPVLLSTLWDYEDLLTNDGCTGIAVLNPNVPQEVQFDEHKLLIVYGQELGQYERVLDSYAVPREEELQFITEAEHVHSSSDKYASQFEELRTRLGMDAVYDMA
jgi:hypothetical protein